MRGSQSSFEHYSRTATIVIDARPLRYAVEMRTNDDQGTIAIKSRIGQHVSSEPLAGAAGMLRWVFRDGLPVQRSRESHPRHRPPWAEGVKLADFA